MEQLKIDNNVEGYIYGLGIKRGSDKAVFLNDIIGLFENTNIYDNYNLFGGSMEIALGRVRIPYIGRFHNCHIYNRNNNSNTLKLQGSDNLTFELDFDFYKINKYDKFKHYCSIHLSNDGWIDLFIRTELFEREILDEYEFKMANDSDKKSLTYREKQQVHLIFCPKQK